MNPVSDNSPESDSDALAHSAPAVSTERQFERAMRAVYERARAEAGYNATYFLRMLADHGGLETARRLLRARVVSEGFMSLAERKRLDLTVEALVTKPEFADLFTPEGVDLARERLTEFGYSG